MVGKILAAAIILWLLAARPLACAAQDSGRTPSDATAVQMSFNILNPSNHQVIGHAEYRSHQVDDHILVIGEDRYKDGEYDVEQDKLATRQGKGLPVMVSFKHTYFNANGSPKMIERADPRSGNAACGSYVAGKWHDISKKLNFPSDTYAGAAAVLALKMAFLDGRKSVNFHIFDCDPRPVVADVTAESAGNSQRFDGYPKPLTQVVVKPEIGFFGRFLGSLLTHRDLWFDPSRGWRYVGGKIERYFGEGPQVLLVREEAAHNRIANAH